MLSWVSLRLLSSRFYFGNSDTEGVFAYYTLPAVYAETWKGGGVQGQLIVSI